MFQYTLIEFTVGIVDVIVGVESGPLPVLIDFTEVAEPSPELFLALTHT